MNFITKERDDNRKSSSQQQEQGELEMNESAGPTHQDIVNDVELQKPRKQKLFYDYHKKRSLGKCNLFTLLCIVLTSGLIAGIFVYLLRNQSQHRDVEINETLPIDKPTSAPSYLSPVYADPSSQLVDALLLIENVTDPRGNIINDVSSLVDQGVDFFVGKFDNPSVASLERSFSWILLDDKAVVGESWLLSRLALVSLYLAMGGSEWTNQENWLSEKPVCEWYGITCDKANSKLEILDLDNNNLVGSIPEEISLLTDLVSLSMKNNNLTGTIPAIALGSIPNLYSIDISNNQLTGGIDKELRNNGVLSTLHLAGNDLTGEWPYQWAENGKSFFSQSLSITADCGDGKTGLDLSRCRCNIFISCYTCKSSYCILN